MTQWRARARSATPLRRVRSLSSGRMIHILTRHPCACERNHATRSRALPHSPTPHSKRGAMRNNGAILTQWRARARSATPLRRARSLSSGRMIHILTRHPCDCERNHATRSRALPRSPTPHSKRGAMRNNGAILTQWRARARSATPRDRTRPQSGGHVLQISTHHPCDCERNRATRSQRYSACSGTDCTDNARSRTRTFL